ncbi:TetR family transcriptional regulator [Streptomyces tendae]
MARWEPNAPERLARAALTLFAERGYDATTVNDIAERAGLTKSTFFRHCNDKREVLFLGQEGITARLAEAVQAVAPGAPPAGVLKAVLDAVGVFFPQEHAPPRPPARRSSPRTPSCASASCSRARSSRVPSRARCGSRAAARSPPGSWRPSHCSPSTPPTVAGSPTPTGGATASTRTRPWTSSSSRRANCPPPGAEGLTRHRATHRRPRLSWRTPRLFGWVRRPPARSHGAAPAGGRPCHACCPVSWPDWSNCCSDAKAVRCT